MKQREEKEEEISPSHLSLVPFHNLETLKNGILDNPKQMSDKGETITSSPHHHEKDKRSQNKDHQVNPKGENQKQEENYFSSERIFKKLEENQYIVEKRFNDVSRFVVRVMYMDTSLRNWLSAGVALATGENSSSADAIAAKGIEMKRI